MEKVEKFGSLYERHWTAQPAPVALGRCVSHGEVLLGLPEGRTQPLGEPTKLTASAGAVPCRAGCIGVYAQRGPLGTSLPRTSTSSSRYSAEVRGSARSAGAKAQSRRAPLPFPPLVAERAALSPLEHMLRG